MSKCWTIAERTLNAPWAHDERFLNGEREWNGERKIMNDERMVGERWMRR